MAEKKKLCKYEPFGKEHTYLSRLYYGVITKKLSTLEIERYFYTLILIKESEGKITQKELSTKITSDKVFTVKILDYLADRNLIKREVNKEDRREHFISLTKKGEKLVPFIAKAFNEANDVAFKGIKKDEQEIYFKVMETMKRNLMSQPADEMKVNFRKIKKINNAI